MSLASNISESLILQERQRQVNDVQIKKDNVLKSTVNEKTENILNGNGENLEDNKMRAVYKFATSLGFSNYQDEESKWHYAVYIPQDVRLQDVLHVYTDKIEALKVMKQSKKARFKQFKIFKEAADFAENGAEPISQGLDQAAMMGEKSASFKGLKPQDLVLFRKAIEAGDIEAVKSAINENPRFLVSSGDTPSILQEGCRYNALHVAAKSDQVAIAEVILNSVESLPLLSRLYDDNDEEALAARSAVLLDLYLNTPDKSGNETPLHFASKQGAAAVVELLTSYRQCQRNVVNKFGATPKDVVCSRASEDKKLLKNDILTMFEERFYLPVLRYEDNSMPARLGEPFSPVKPLEIPTSPLSPRIEMPAYAGPMSKDQVSDFMKKWQTPPKALRGSELRLTDPEKGHERFARSLAHDFKVPWREYWSFLDNYVDLSSKEGLDLLEKYLHDRFEETTHESLSSIVETNETLVKTDVDDETVISPITDLCKAFNACSLDNEQEPRRHSQKRFSDKSKRRKDLKLNVNHKLTFEMTAPDRSFSSLLCAERSCHVFGKRICNAILLACSSADAGSLCSENIRDSLETEVKHLQALVNGYQLDARFQSLNFDVVHSRVASVAIALAWPLLSASEKPLLRTCLRSIALVDGTVSDDEDILFSSRRDEQSSLGAVLKTHVLCLTECLLTQLNMSTNVETDSVQNEAECHSLWALATPCACDWEPYSHQARARAAWRRQQKLIPRILNFKHDEEPVIEEAWRSCDEVQQDEDIFHTPPSSPKLSESDDQDAMEDSISLGETFIYPGDAPTKTDLAVLDTISDSRITPETYPSIYLWRHLVLLHQNNVVPRGQVAPSPGAWHRRRLAMPTTPRSKESPTQFDSPRRQPWERVTGPYSPSSCRRQVTPLNFR